MNRLLYIMILAGVVYSAGSVRAQVPAATAEPPVRILYNMNSIDRDNTPVISADGRVMYFNSTRKGSARPWAHYDSIRGRFDDDIYCAVYDAGKDDWVRPENIGQPLNTASDDAVASLSVDGNTMYFVSLKRGWEADGGPFYKATGHGTVWNNISGLGGGITQFFTDANRHFRLYGASISPDGQWFYFATTAQSDNDDQQIWVSHLVEGVGWTGPQNLGPEINNAGGSYAPFIAADGITLYFASRRAGGQGGDDLWMSVNRGDRWDTPRNLGPDINTPGDESFPSLAASGEIAYFSRGGLGMDDDIYAVRLPEDMRPSSMVLLSGFVLDGAGAPLAALITVQDLKTGKVLDVAKSNPTTGRYTTVMRPGATYGISVRAITDEASYAPKSDNYTVPQNGAEKQLARDFTLEKLEVGKSFGVNNIFFELGSAAISPESVPELERLADLMRRRPALRIEVGGHTDNAGSPVYNNNLSLQRARAIRDYLIKKAGIEAYRIQAQGYGSSKPLSTNDTKEGRRLNRRTECTVLAL